MQCLRLSCKSYLRRYSTLNSGYVLEQLTNKSIIRIYGQDTATFLQGLVTNDMQHLVNGAGSMFAMFLNTKGRVLFDTIIYRCPNNKAFYLEVDKRATDVLMQHLKMYRLRRKVDITPANELKVWVHFNSYISVSTTKGPEDKLVQGRIVPCTSLEKSDNTVVTKNVGDKQLLIYRDPRLTALGIRILAPGGTGVAISELFPGSGHDTYKWFRYKLGVGEGIDELPPGNCFPLEANCDYLHGVSFHKGCYIGQELTARTHHTGVVRKRLMPLYLTKLFLTEPHKDEVIKANDANVGKLRGYFNKCAIGLIRIAPALEADKLTVNNTTAITLRPSWWPQEATKEKVSSGRL